MEWPAREGVSSRYSEVKHLATALRAISEAKPGPRKTLLADYAASETPEVSAAAVHLLAECEPNRAKEGAEALLKKELPPAGFVAADEVLSQADTEWPTSSKRKV